jgi:hypothetical protein
LIDILTPGFDASGQVPDSSVVESIVFFVGRKATAGVLQIHSAPDSGTLKSASDVMDSMEGKTVSMKVYVGTIIAIVVLMTLARCGG